MTSPRQRKKRLRLKLAKEKQEALLKQEAKQDIKPVETVATPAQAVVESTAPVKSKKAKNGLVELEPQQQVVEQPKAEVKNETKE